MGTVTATRESGATADTLDLIVVKQNGEIQSFDGDKLQEKWTSPASALGRDSATPIADSKVEFAQLTNAHAASQGILKGHQGALELFSQEISEEGFNPDVLIIITKADGQSPSRNIHIVALPRNPTTQSSEVKRSVQPLLTAALRTSRQFQDNVSFGVHVSSGIIQQLSGTYLTTFDMNGSFPSEISQLKTKYARSFLRLSGTSVMVSSGTNLTVYSSKFKATLASIPLPPEYLIPSKEDSTREARTCPCNLVSYFPKLGIAVAIANNGLLAVQIEGKSRIDGLLIDSLGCSVRGQTRPGRGASGSAKVGLTTLVSYLPGSMVASGMPSKIDMKAIDEAVSSGDVLQFEALLASKLPIASKNIGDGPAENTRNRSEVDRRWVIYALSKIFTWSKVDEGGQRLTVKFYPPNVFMWLLGSGNMTISNIELALRDRIQQSGLEFIPAGELVDAIVELDPSMDLLFALVSLNFLGASELLAAIRRLMESLELFGEGAATRQGLLTNGEESNLENGDIEEQVAALEAEAEADLAMAEYQLGPGSGVRGEALSLALSKLYTCPTDAIVYALQTAYTSQEIVSLIYLLRFEMARGAWTSRYLDDEHLDIADNETAAPDNTILLISSLLCNCIDAVGAGGWLAGNARLVSSNRFEAEDLISSLKLEVSAALEGLEEAAYLKGLTSEMVRYGNAMLKWRSGPEGPPGKKQKTSHKPVILPASAPESKILPLGLKAEQQVSLLRVGAGGEVHERSARDIGRLKSQKVGKYSLERIVV
jgi:hypothetical protein